MSNTHPLLSFERWHALAVLILLVVVLMPANAFACACRLRGVRRASSLLPTGPGGTVFLEYDFLDQTKNWSGNNSAPAANNTDKEIRSNFLVAGGQYMFNSSWGVMAEIPYTDRYFRTSDPGDPGTFSHGASGDIRLMGVYSGSPADMSTGLVFGVKLPTGDHNYPNFDADVEIGSGSTDLLIGSYHSGSLTADRSFSYFTQILYPRSRRAICLSAGTGTQRRGRRVLQQHPVRRWFPYRADRGAHRFGPRPRWRSQWRSRQ